MTRAISIHSVKKGKNNNYLIFTGYVPSLDTNKAYTFEYIGTETKTTAALTEKTLENFTKALQKDFKFAPFDLKTVKKQLGAGKHYMIEG